MPIRTTAVVYDITTHCNVYQFIEGVHAYGGGDFLSVSTRPEHTERPYCTLFYHYTVRMPIYYYPIYPVRSSVIEIHRGGWLLSANRYGWSNLSRYQLSTHIHTVTIVVTLLKRFSCEASHTTHTCTEISSVFAAAAQYNYCCHFASYQNRNKYRYQKNLKPKWLSKKININFQNLNRCRKCI